MLDAEEGGVQDLAAIRSKALTKMKKERMLPVRDVAVKALIFSPAWIAANWVRTYPSASASSRQKINQNHESHGHNHGHNDHGDNHNHYDRDDAISLSKGTRRFLVPICIIPPLDATPLEPHALGSICHM